jgi:hypothetical protein
MDEEKGRRNFEGVEVVKGMMIEEERRNGGKGQALKRKAVRGKRIFWEEYGKGDWKEKRSGENEGKEMGEKGGKKETEKV